MSQASGTSLVTPSKEPLPEAPRTVSSDAIVAQQEDPVVKRRNCSIGYPTLRHAELSEYLVVLERNRMTSFSSLSSVSSNA